MPGGALVVHSLACSQRFRRGIVSGVYVLAGALCCEEGRLGQLELLDRLVGSTPVVWAGSFGIPVILPKVHEVSLGVGESFGGLASG